MEDAADLAPEQLRALDLLTKVPALAGYYLAGGTAIALHLHHRQSRDLDFFSLENSASIESMRQHLATELAQFSVISESEVTLSLLVANTPVDFVAYPYPTLEAPLETGQGCKVAGLKDLAVMKLAAVSKRGIRRDFWDLHEILTRSPLTLSESLSLYRKRFGLKQADSYHVLRSLTYF
ncbi:MAG TPA: nucleotidyl transferase AbiEii/AbiGii toxin family protein, partial [Polyangiaceae bacterium]|nr:nucleotidyl transferase AbiEii/AbiGii toxin family protein [Polyangiaceae bacterium]